MSEILNLYMRSSILTHEATMAYPAKVMAYFRGENKISNQNFFSGGAIHIEYTFILKKIGGSFKYCRSKAKSSLPPHIEGCHRML